VRYLLLIFVLIYSSTAQQDSLELLLSKTNKIDEVIEYKIALSKIYFADDSEKGILTAKEAYSTAQKKYPKLEGEAMLNYSEVLIGNGEIDAATKLLNDNKGKYKDDNKVSAGINSHLGIIELDKENYKLATELFNQSLSQYTKIDDKQGIAESHFHLGLVSKNQGDYEIALESYKLAYNIYSDLNDLEGKASCLGNMGSIYKNQGNYKKALESVLEALKTNEKLGRKNAIANNLGNIALIYNTQSDYRNALNYFEKSLQIAEEMGNKNSIALNLGNIGLAYMNLEDYTKALVNLNKALTLNKELNHKKNIALNLTNIGIVNQKLGKYKEAKKLLEEGLKIYIDLGVKDKIASAYIRLGEVYAEDKNYSIARTNIEKGINIAEEIGLLEWQKEGYLSYSNVLAATGNYEWAFESLKQHGVIKDSINNLQSQEALTRLSIEFDTERKEKENSLLKMDNEIKEVNIARQNLIIYSTIAGIVLLGLLAFFIYTRFLMKKKSNLLLEEKNAHIEEQNIELETLNEDLVERNEEIMSSIRYAEKIQSVILPPNSFFNNNFKEHFILYLPKDIVSGDFYWAMESNNIKYVAVGDCTGHGVPGAMLTILGNNALSEIVLENNNLKPSEILYKLNSKITYSLSTDGDKTTRDGMDIGIVAIDNSSNKLYFSGAKRSLVIITKDNHFEELKGSRYSIGDLNTRSNIEFEDIEHSISSGDTIYLFSDGYADQSNINKKKIGTKHFKQMIINNNNNNLNEIRELIHNYYKEFSQGELQRDDITVLGIRI